MVVTVAVAGSWRREEKENGRQEKRKMLGKAALHEQNKTCSKERTREEKKIKNSRKREKERERNDTLSVWQSKKSRRADFGKKELGGRHETICGSLTIRELQETEGKPGEEKRRTLESAEIMAAQKEQKECIMLHRYVRLTIAFEHIHPSHSNRKLKKEESTQLHAKM